MKKGVIDNAGNILVPPIYDEIEPSPLDIFAGKKDGKTLLFNGDGTIRVPLIYQHINPNLNGFTNQKGFAAVTKNDKERNSWGIIKNDGKVIVPEKYAYVHVVNEKLFVGRIDGEKKLDFFNEKGENIGSLDGRKIQSPSLDDTCFGLEGIDRKVIFYTSDLKPVTPDNPKLGYWTNGKGTILESKEEGGINRKGMVDKGGKTIIPFEFQSFKKGLDDQFICVKNNKNYNDSLFVVFDNKGKKIIPEGQYSITLFGDIYLVRSLTSDVFEIYTKDGKKLLPGQFLGTPIKLAENYHREMADHKKYDYIELKNSIN